MKRVLILFFCIFLLAGTESKSLFAQVVSGFDAVNGLLEHESFEGGDFPPENWSKITNFDGSGWRRGQVGETVLGMESFGTIDTPPSGGDYVAYVSWATGDADSNYATNQSTDQWLITPQISGIEIGDSLVFYLKYFESFTDRIDILISTTGIDSTTFFDSTLAILTFIDGSSNDWQKYSYSLSKYEGQDIYIAFRQHISFTFSQGDAFLLDLVGVTSLITSVSENNPQPDDFTLMQNYPNPFNPMTNISFNLKESSEVTLKVYNLIGQEVNTILLNELEPAGLHTVSFNGANLPNGIYYYKIEAGSFVAVKRMTLLK